MTGKLRVVVDNTQDTRGKRVSATSRDRGLMASRFSQIAPETIATVQSQLERGEIRDWCDVCDRMFQRDDVIPSSYESRLSVISASELVVEPGIMVGDAARDAATLECARWTDAWIHRLAVSEHAHESLDGIGKGVAVHEIERAATEDGLVPVALHWMHARRFRYGDDWKLRVCDMGGDVAYSSSGYELEPDRFLVHEPRVLPGYPCGGVLRPVLWLFTIKGWAVQFWVGGAEQHAWPITVGEVTRSTTEQARERMKEILEDLSYDHTAVLDPNMAIRLIETTVKDGKVWSSLVDWCDKGIAKVMSGMTDLAEPTKVGSYASVEVRAGKTVEARVLKDERALATTWTRDLVEPAIRHNLHRWPVRPETPRLRWRLAQKVAPLDALAVPTMTVDEVRERQGLPPRGGAEGAMLMRDFVARAGGSA